MKIKIQIKNYLTGSILFEFEKENNTIKDTIIEAVKNRANLWEANLWEANLRGANFRGADLWEANLWEAVLREADLWEANLREANLRGAKNLDSDRTDYWWHIHHETLYEWLTEPIRARINYIKTEKAKNETPEQIELRLKLLKPVLGKIPSTQKGWERLHKRECGCGFDGKTIFTKANNYEEKSME